jgi:2'-5' RNA ligase
MMSEFLRAFIAVKIPPSHALEAVIAQLAAFGKPVKTVSAQQLHITLKFLGDTDREQLPRIGQILEQTVAAHASCEVRLAGLGAFPHLGRPSVIWVGLDNAETLVAIAAELEKQLKPLGFPPEGRPFQPHLTVARLKARPPDELTALVTQHQTAAFGSARVRSVELIQSELLSEGPRYTVLASAELH